MLVFFNKSSTVILYLKPFNSFKRSLKKFLRLNLLAFNCKIGSFFQLFQLYMTLHAL